MSASSPKPAPSAAPPDSGRSRGLVHELRGLAFAGLPRMYRPDAGLFVFRLRRRGAGVVEQGLSPRYTAITLVGLAGEDADQVRPVLHGQGTAEVCDRLLESAARFDNLGDVALSLWAAAALRRPAPERVRARLQELKPDAAPHPTVELAWTLTALSLDPEARAPELRTRVAQRLLAAFDARSGLFPHVIGASGSRSHVCCFADLVYPTQALAHYFRAAGERAALDASRRCAEQMCRLQGPAGQWWWHYDVRTGRVVEGYPVYAVHQDSMAPMALFAAEDAGAGDFSQATARGLEWLRSSPELGGGTLIDRPAGLIWRKVARREPRKLARYLQAGASRLHPSLRVPGLDALLPPTAIDDEDRPYHLGWILHAFPPSRAARW